MHCAPCRRTAAQPQSFAATSRRTIGSAAPRDGELLFDDDEYVYVKDPSVVPAELRALFDLAWVDLDAKDELHRERPSPLAVGLAMAELVTGIEVSAEQVEAAYESGFVVGPNLVYAASLDD